MAPPPPPSATAASCAAVLHSVHSLASYSDTLADFLDQWNSVLLDVASIAATFAAHLPGPESEPKPVPLLNPPPEQESEPEHSPAPEPEREDAPSPSPQPKPSPNPEREDAPSPSPQTKPSPNPEREDAPSPQPKPSPNPEDPAAALQLGLLCEKMSSRDLRRFVTARLADSHWLRAVGPDALRRAPDPAALVLRAVGRYYISAESLDAEAACALLLELYVRAGCPRRAGRGEARLREEAREAVLTWRSRLVRVSGRLAAAGTREARGLTLFMAAFGVPVEFPLRELYDLLAAGDSLSCTKVLRSSKLFVKTMRDAVVEMLNKDMYLQAIRIIIAFEFQNAFPLAPTLTHIMEKVEHSRKKEMASKERDEEELALLRLISKCADDHKLCPSEFSSFGIAERIMLLEQHVGQPKQALTGTKRKKPTDEDNAQQNAPWNLYAQMCAPSNTRAGTRSLK